MKLTIAPAHMTIMRNAWGTIAFAMIIGTLCIAISIVFFNALYLDPDPEHHAPVIFVILFCGLFFLAGTAILLRLPRQGRTWLANGGAQIIKAEAQGMIITPTLGGPSYALPWEAITQIVLAKTLKCIELDETSYAWNMVIVHLSPDYKTLCPELGKPFAGASLTGDGVAYISASYPSRQQSDTHFALRQFAPTRIAIQSCRTLTFDYKSRHSVMD
ncbi:MAG: hypothetical protein SFW65_08070 [Alphaproteobacteria bacterium]|nr:hypothetical protein [Alphaproteobacteria bacterium]